MDLKLKGVFRPEFFSIFRKGKYDAKTFASDLTAGIIVGIIALPLAIAFGIASGVSPQQGLITAIVAGLLVSMFGGSRYLIGGPTMKTLVATGGTSDMPVAAAGATARYHGSPHGWRTCARRGFSHVYRRRR